MQNPLESYRRTQRELRRQFETFTRANCPTCPTPCCRRPARIAPTDILLAEATGWRTNLPASSPSEQNTSEQNTNVTQSDDSSESANNSVDMVAATAARFMDALSANDNEDVEANYECADDLPCEYLGEKGCTFPTDLRPFGCTTYICKYMYARLDRPTLTRLKRLVRELDDKHAVLLRTLRHSKLPPERGE